MRKLILLIMLACFFAVSLISCDVTGEESFDFEPGDSLAIVGPTSLTIPDNANSVTGSYYSQGFTIQKEYAWSVSGSAQGSVYREGEYNDVTFTEPGTYTISVDDGEYQGSTEVTIE